jgi:soluble lytic murein transglycosylase-like protein
VRRVILIMTAMALGGVAALASAWEEPARAICEPMGVPLRLVRAVIAVESGGDPYVIHARIGDTWRVYRLSNRVVAEAILDAVLQHTTWIDVGLMQIHVRLWSKPLGVLPNELLDIDTNLRAGCTILSRYLEGEGPLWQRIGRYHSKTPTRNEVYAEKVLRVAIADVQSFD